MGSRCWLPHHHGWILALDFDDLGGKVNEADVLSSETLFAKELCDLLVNLEAAILGSSKEIASILIEKAMMGKVKKVKAYLSSNQQKLEEWCHKDDAHLVELSCPRSFFFLMSSFRCDFQYV
jgi:hypothetical protein